MHVITNPRWATINVSKGFDNSRNGYIHFTQFIVLHVLGLRLVNSNMW